MLDFSVMLILVVVLALLFDFSNGWHDSANAIATVVSTRVLSPLAAVRCSDLSTAINSTLRSLSALMYRKTTWFMKSWAGGAAGSRGALRKGLSPVTLN